jgi:carbonic anhydrase/acetyltransferase-like protein (isoleucine patch superfamily)
MRLSQRLPFSRGSSVATPFIHPTAVVLGRVQLAEDTSVWPTAVLRGDTDQITIGARSNVQDGAVIHADPGIPTVVGADCVIGHRAIVHGTVLEDGVLVGMGAILLNRVHVGAGSIIAAGAVVLEGTQIPPGSLVVGVPGKVVRQLSEAQQAAVRENAGRYVALAQRHRRGEIAAIVGLQQE